MVPLYINPFCVGCLVKILVLYKYMKYVDLCKHSVIDDEYYADDSNKTLSVLLSYFIAYSYGS